MVYTVAYLGPPSTYSHQATLSTFPPDEYDHVPCVQIADILSSVEQGATDFGVVPFENSTNGSVVQSLDLFCDREGLFPSVKVRGEVYLDVHHCLLGHPRGGDGGISRDTVSRIYSHPQAFGQCEKFLTEHLKGVERIDVSSTSKAADLANKDPSAVAIASSIAASVHQGLQILAENIEERSDNTTRFLVISKETVGPSPIQGSDKTFMTFTVHHEQPGALCDMLMVFKEFGMNLTSISSRPSLNVAWNYIFLVEFEGHQDAKHVQKALQKMKKYCRSMRVFGSYESTRGLKRTVESTG
ncbi:prephenate dehydratase [Arthrobotrys musiformis]|uniref:prephenate dehydratase n=1 Tax=Arthrobotrys musiformis TaxID=47236 RepID=A0AAV9WFY7_9PEZI